MSRDLDTEIAIELERLRHLIAVHEPLLDQCANSVPSAIELSALAALLHSFYTGIENLFKRIVISIDKSLPQGDAWHRQLLETIAVKIVARDAVVSRLLLDKLSQYLAFRHVFRHAYSFDLRWEKMAWLVLNVRPTLEQVELELTLFLQNHRASGATDPS